MDQWRILWREKRGTPQGMHLALRLNEIAKAAPTQQP